jgi:hypothetical protein
MSRRGWADHGANMGGVLDGILERRNPFKDETRGQYYGDS